MLARQDTRTEEWLEKARNAAAIIQEHREEGERERRLPAPVFDALRDTGLLKLWAPARYGGHEVSNLTRVQVVEEVARQDGAAGWNLFVGGTGGYMAEYLPPDRADEVFGGGQTTVAGSFAPDGRALPVEGGHRVTGSWSFASGLQQATWLVASAITIEDGKPRMVDGKPDIWLYFLPASECRIIDNWFTLGMRGTGSNGFEVSDAFVPEGRAFRFEEVFAPPRGSSSQPPFVAMAMPAIAAVGLGVARDAVDSFKELAARKTPRGGPSSLLGYHTVHEKVGRAEAMLAAARAYLFDVVSRIDDPAGSPEERTAQLRLAGTFAAETAAEVARNMFTAGGGSAVYATSRLERCFRDANMVTQHTLVQPMNFEMVGQYYLGLGLQLRR